MRTKLVLFTKDDSLHFLQRAFLFRNGNQCKRGIHVSCNCKFFNTVTSPRFMRSIVFATFLLKYFVLSKCVRLFVCCAVAFDVTESLSNINRVMVMFIRCHSIYKSWLCVCYEKQQGGSFLLSRNIKTLKLYGLLALTRKLKA